MAGVATGPPRLSASGRDPKERTVADTQEVGTPRPLFAASPVQPQDVHVVESAEQVDYEASRPVRFSLSMAENAPVPIEFKLHQMSIQQNATVTAQVKLVNLTDRALLTELPTPVKTLAQKLFFSGQASQVKHKSKLAEMEATATRIKNIARAYGCAGFLDPKLVLTEEEEARGEGIFVDRIPLHDLQEFMRICEGDEQLAERRLTRFSE